MFIQTEDTDNPDRIKFLPGRPVLPGRVLDYASRDAALRSPLARELFDIEGVAGVALGPDYIAVTKTGGDWRFLKPMILGVLMDHFLTGAPVVVETADANEPLAEQVREALRLVIDPELGFNIVDLGLIYDVAVSGNGAVRVTMTTTTRGCPATNYLKEGSREAAGSVVGAEAVEVELTYEPPWTPQMMSDAAKSHFNMFE